MSGKIKTLLGFAQKAGKIVSGEEGCKNCLKQGKAFLIIVSQDASETTKSSMRFITSLNGIDYAEWGSKDALGLIIGKSPRSSVAVLDQHFAREIGKLLEVSGSN